MVRLGIGSANCSMTSASPSGGDRCCQRVDGGVDDRRDAGRQRLQPMGGEVWGEQVAQPGVVRRVGEPQPARVEAG